MASQPRRDERDRSGARGSALKGVGLVLLLGECVVILVPSIYGRATPKLFGIPFFYWFQLLWIIVGMVVTGLAYVLFRETPAAAQAPDPDRQVDAR